MVVGEIVRRILKFIIIAGVAYAAIAIGKLQEYPLLMWIGVIVGALIGLAVLVKVTKWIVKFVGRSMTSVLYLLAVAVIIGVLLHNNIISPMIGYGVGIALGGAVLLMFTRRLSKWAQKSLMGGEIFGFLSGYQIKSYLTQPPQGLMSKEEKINISIDYKNVTLVLRDMGYTAALAKEATAYALNELPPDSNLEDKIRTALQYISSGQTIETYKARQN